MRSHFVTKADHKTIRAEWWDEDEHVVIRKFSYGDRQALANETVKVGMTGQSGQEKMITDVQIGRMNLAILQRGIVSWTLKGPDGKIAQLNQQMIEALNEEDAEFILAAINTLNPRRRRTAEEQANFRGAGGDGSARGESSAA